MAVHAIKKATMRRALWLLPLLLFACDNDEASTRGSLGGQLTKIENGEGFGPAPVALYELPSLRVIAAQNADAEGHFLFVDLEPGDYTPVVYAERRILLHLERPSYRVDDDVHVQLDLPMAPLDAYDQTGLFLDGRVVDRDDDTPIPLALVEITAPTSVSLEFFSEIDGRSGPLTRLSDEAGTFRLGPLPILVMPNGDRMIPHLRVSHPYYGDVARGPWLVETLPAELTLALQRGADPGWIGGRILSYPDSTPVADVAVSLEWQAVEGRFPKLLPPELIAYSDGEGRFELGGVALGRHRILAGLLPDDGWIGFGRSISLGADSLLLEEPLLVSEAVRLLIPKDGATVDSLEILDWSEHPAAVAYRPFLQRLLDGASWGPGFVAESHWGPGAAGREFLAPGGRFLWSVTAFDGLGRDISLSERPSLFQLPPAETPIGANQ